ncbi:MAG: M1 family metallopeptidase [Acidobacteria bacterium]|nr:M1 family metallopeptidase [Acidobacteriota bacterium]
MKKLLFVFIAVFLPNVGLAQRLPQGVVPEHYQLSFTPDLQNATFAGDEIIDVRLSKPATTIVLNAAELKFVSATVESHGSTVTAKIALDPDREQASIIAPHEIAAGSAKLHFVFNGTLNNKLSGFYLSQTARRRYAVTQFEATDARRAFPSFDEPDKKATFDITLVVDKGDTAISNEKLISDIPGPGDGKHTLHFATTKKLSTYLVAMLVGDFQCLSGETDGVPIRACATPDKVQNARFALEAEEYALHYYNDYFGIPYPFGKLDLIAVPDFAAGAMENAGAITYRESDMLLDPKVATLDNYQRVGVVVAHETAHQWFGDLVTMKWWDNIWLNEGFASWMETRPLAKWKPEWHEELGEVAETNRTLSFDALKNTRPIRQKAETPAEINELFDGIAYGKAASVLRMVEYYIGPEVFRKGVQTYLQAHEFGNATAEDFWTTMTRVSGKPVDKIMSSFVVQAGEPLLHVSEDNGQKAVSQERMFADRELLGTSQQFWNVPVCFHPVTPQGNEYCSLISSRGQETGNPQSALIFANAHGHGYYRTEYERNLQDQLTKQLESGLLPAERISILGDQWALMRVGRLPIGKYLDLVSQLKGERLRAVWDPVLESLDYLHRELITDDERSHFQQFVLNVLRPVYAEVKSSSDPEQKTLAADLFERLGLIGRDSEVIAQARDIAQKALRDPDSADPLTAGPALVIAASQGDDALFNQLAEALENTSDQTLRRRYMNALSRFEKPELVQKAMELGISGTIRNQDASSYLGTFLRNPAARESAWKFLETHWRDVEQTFVGGFGNTYLVEDMGSFCAADAVSRVSGFFRVHPVPGAERTMRQAVERINSCIDLRKLQGADLQSWLVQHSTVSSAAGK